MNNSQATLNNSQLESLTSLPAEKLSTATLKKNMSQIMKELIDELPGWLSRFLLKLNLLSDDFYDELIQPERRPSIIRRAIHKVKKRVNKVKND